MAKYALPGGSPSRPLAHIHGLPGACPRAALLRPEDWGFESDSVEDVMAHLCRHLFELKLCEPCLKATYAVMRPDVVELKKRLLEIGGDGFQIPGFVEEELSPEHVSAMLESGSAVSGAGAIFYKGKSRECHDNSRRYAAKRPDKRTHYSGMALSEDGCWRVHSWVVGPKGIVETTVERAVYFGVPAKFDTNFDEQPNLDGQ